MCVSGFLSFFSGLNNIPLYGQTTFCLFILCGWGAATSGYCESCGYGHRCTNSSSSPGFQFLWAHARRRDCRSTWEFCVWFLRNWQTLSHDGAQGPHFPAASLTCGTFSFSDNSRPMGTSVCFLTSKPQLPHLCTGDSDRHRAGLREETHKEA